MVRKLHRLAGIVMLLPFLGWAVTGIVFFTKPGYGAAYDALPIKAYPLEGPSPCGPIRPGARSGICGPSSARTCSCGPATGWSQLDPVSLQPAPAPPDGDVQRLLADAFTANPARYGRIVSLAGGVATTDTGAVVTFDWNRLSLQQRGRDTDRIDRLYKVHYLQWTGQKTADKVLGLAGLTLLIALTLLGARLAFRR